MTYKSADIPVLLFPLKIEARFIGVQPRQLWLRVFPDEAFLQSHNPALTAQERADAFSFKALDDVIEVKKETWNDLVSKYGAYRAAYLVQISISELEKQAKSPEEYEVIANADAEFYYKGLPEQLVAYLYPTLEDKPIMVEGKIINERDRLLIFKENTIETEDKNWLTNFDEAKLQGMAFVVEDEALGDYEKFERIIVTGFYYRNKDEENPTKSADALKELFDNHLYTEGLSFLDYGTATNNLGREKSAYSVRDEFDAEASFDSMVQAYSNEELQNAVGSNLAQGLGIGEEDFKYFKQADIKTTNFAHFFQKLSWFALGGEHLQKLFGDTISSAAHERLWRHYSEHVKARGLYPCIKIGDQPYGILPVGRTQEMLTVENITTILGENQNLNDSVLMKTYLIIALLLREWKKMLSLDTDRSVPRIEDTEDTLTEIHKILSMEPSSSILQLRTLSYDKIKGKLPRWLQEAANIPAPLALIPVGQVYDILQNRTEGNVHLKFDSIENDAQKIFNLFSKILKKVGNNDDYFGFLTQAKEQEQFRQNPLLNLGNVKATSFDDMELTIQQEELEYLEAFFTQIQEDANNISPTGKLNRQLSYTYQGTNEQNEAVDLTIYTDLFLYNKEASLFSDLLLRSFSNAIALYNRTIYFQPNNEDLVGFTAYHIHAIKKKEGDSIHTNNIILEIRATRSNGSTKDIKIKSPIKGIIQPSCVRVEKEGEEDKHYGICIKEGDIIRPGQALFKVCEVESYKRILGEFAETGFHFLNEFECNIILNSSWSVEDDSFKVKDVFHGNGELLIVFEEDYQLKFPALYTIKESVVKKDTEISDGDILFKINNKMKYLELLKSGTYNTLDDISIQYDLPIKKLQSVINEVIDLNSYRLDAWASSLANARLKEMRQKTESKKGIYFGAYGWLENLEKDTERIVTEEIIYEDNEGDDDGEKVVKEIFLLDENRNDDGGIIHCPSPAQSLTATIFKNSYLSHEDEVESSNPFTLNLTSDRIQKSERFMEGIRQDQPIEALLGYQLERMLHDKGMNTDIYTLREKYPLEVNIVNRADNNPDVGFTQLSVIDGLKVIEASKNPITADTFNKDLKNCIDKLEDTLDGSLDHLFFEAGYQLTQRNLSQSAAAMDAAKGLIAPPVTDALKTKIPGVGIQHKLIYVFPKSTKTHSISNCRAFIEPVLEEWLELQLGSLDKIGCIVELLDEEGIVVETNAVKLSDLNITHLDFLYLSDQEVSDGASELELCIINKLPVFDKKLRYRITKQAPAECQSLTQAIEVAQYTFHLLTKSRGLKTEDIGQEEAPIQDWNSLEQIKNNRFLRLLNELKIWKSNPNTYNEQLSKLDLTEAKRAWITKTDIDLDKIGVELTTMITVVEEALLDFDKKLEAQIDFDQTFRVLEKVAKTLFGKAFILLPPAKVSANLNPLLTNEMQERLIGNTEVSTGNWGQERIQTWIQELAQVKENMEVFEEWQMVKYAWQQTTAENSKYRVAQFPSGTNYPWLGLSKNEIQNLLNSEVYKNVGVYQAPDEAKPYPMDGEAYYPEGSNCVMFYSDQPIDFNETQFGIVIEEFSEHIPNEQLETGMSFHYNAPNNEAPQVLLLAVSSPFTEEGDTWNEDKLRDIIFDTMDLMKIRMIDLDAMQDYGYVLPMTNLTHIPTVN